MAGVLRAGLRAGGGQHALDQLFVEHDDLGALNLYGRHTNAFDDESERVGLLFASHAAIAFADAERVRNLRIAVDRRDIIGQGKGILMERYRITADQAFDLLRRASQESNRKVFDVAWDLASTGDFPSHLTPN